MTSAKHQTEALLFSSGKTMTIEQLADLAGLSREKIKRALKALKKDYEKRDSAITIDEDERGWKMTVTNEFLPLVKSIVADTELSKATMETLAIIAYNYPDALQSEVVDTRGGNAYEHIKELEDLGFVRKQRSGRTYELRLTEKFFEYFQIEGEQDIRKVFRDVRKPSKEEQRKLGEMDVVDVEKETEDEELVGDLEVVGVEEEQEEESEEEQGSRKDFLDEIDKKIESIVSRNDAHEEDPLLKREDSEESGGDEEGVSRAEKKDESNNTT